MFKTANLFVFVSFLLTVYISISLFPATPGIFQLSLEINVPQPSASKNRSFEVRFVLLQELFRKSLRRLSNGTNLQNGSTTAFID